MCDTTLSGDLRGLCPIDTTQIPVSISTELKPQCSPVIPIFFVSLTDNIVVENTIQASIS